MLKPFINQHIFELSRSTYPALLYSALCKLKMESDLARGRI